MEGAILTVSKDIAKAAEDAKINGNNLIEILDSVIKAADISVKNTPNLLPILKQAGVVDSGGKGLYIILEGMLRHATGKSVEMENSEIEAMKGNLESVQLNEIHGDIEDGQDFEIVVDFKPQGDLDLKRFYDELSHVGTSIQVGEGDDLYRMHIHVPTENKYEPIELVNKFGNVQKVYIENLMEQMDQGSKEEDFSNPVEPDQIAVIAISPGNGISKIFKSLGVSRLVNGGQSMNPSTNDILQAFNDLPTDKIIILPNNKNIILAAEAAKKISEKQVTVIPTKNIPQPNSRTGSFLPVTGSAPRRPWTPERPGPSCSGPCSSATGQRVSRERLPSCVAGIEPGHEAVVFKATAQGMVHGHFDKLTWLFYDNGREIISDYGAARFLNVEEKNGGHYLPENDTWAKQTIAHNTLVVDESSHFGGDWNKGELSHPEMLFFELGEKADAVAARMEGAYEGVVFSRALVLLKGDQFPEPVVLDVLKVESDQQHQYDLPLYFKGQVTAVNRAIDASTRTMTPLGEKNGYQHLWLRARARASNEELFQLTWLNTNRFYTWSVLPEGELEVLFTELGANDPEFNLRREQGVVLRAADSSRRTFVSVLEPHGEYNGSREFTTASSSHISAMQRVSNAGNDIIRIFSDGGEYTTVAISWNPDPGSRHSAEIDGASIDWSGFYKVIDGQGRKK